MCGLVITTQNEQIQTIVGDEKDPLSHGHICPKALAYKDLHDTVQVRRNEQLLFQVRQGLGVAFVQGQLVPKIAPEEEQV